jgi:glycosyltransferase involved in cell wall biosynthesis
MILPARVVIPMLGFGRSGGNRVLSRLATEWSLQGLDVTLLTHVSSEQPYFPTQARIVYVGNDGRPVAYPGGPNTKPVHPLIQMKALRAALSRADLSDAVALANHNLTVWPVATARGIGRRIYYIQAYEPEYYQGGGGLFRRLVLWHMARWSYMLHMQQVVNSPLYLSNPALTARQWVPPGIDLDVFHPCEEPRTGPKHVVGCIGRRETEKGTADVLQAFLQLRHHGVDTTLKVAYGSVPDSLLGRDDIEVVIPQNDVELANFYRSLDVLVAPGHLQLGAVHYPVLEGMASGVPVVHTGYLPGTKENSWIVPIKDPAAIASCVEGILATSRGSEDVRLAAATLAAAEFSWPRVASRWLPIFSGQGGGQARSRGFKS